MKEKIAKSLWCCAASQTPPTVFGTNLNCLPTLQFARIVSNVQKLFSQSLTHEDFFYFWDRPGCFDECD